MKILYNNLKTSATTSTSSADPAFPVSNLNRLATTDEWRSASMTTSASVTMDLGSAKTINFVGVVGNCYTRSLPATTVTLEGDTTNSFLTTTIGSNTSIGPAGSATSGASCELDGTHTLVVHGNGTEMRAIVVNPAALSSTGSTVIRTASVDSISVAKLDATRAIVVFRDKTDTNALKAVCLIISGYSVSAAAPYTLGTASTQDPYLKVVCQASMYAVVMFRSESTQYPTALTLYYAGTPTVQSVGSRATIESTVGTAQALSAHSSTDMLCCYRNSGGMLRGSVLSRSHVTLTANAPANLIAGDYPCLAATGATSTTQVLAYFDSDSGDSRQITISGTTFSVGSSVGTTYLAGAAMATGMTRMSSTKFVVGYYNVGQSAPGFYTITLSGATTTQSSRTESGSYAHWSSPARVSDTQVLMVQPSLGEPRAKLLTFAAAFTQTLTVVPGEALAWAAFTNKSYRYWRITFNNPSGTYTGCSAVYLGQSFEFADNCFGTELTLTEADLTDVRFSNTGRRFIDSQAVRVKTLNLNLSALNKTEAGQWRDFANFVGKSKPFFLMVDDSYAVLDSDQVLSGQFMLNDSLSISQTNFGFWSTDFTITEVI